MVADTSSKHGFGRAHRGVFPQRDKARLPQVSASHPRQDARFAKPMRPPRQQPRVVSCSSISEPLLDGFFVIIESAKRHLGAVSRRMTGIECKGCALRPIPKRFNAPARIRRRRGLPQLHGVENNAQSTPPSPVPKMRKIRVRIHVDRLAKHKKDAEKKEHVAFRGGHAGELGGS